MTCYENQREPIMVFKIWFAQNSQIVITEKTTCAHMKRKTVHSLSRGNDLLWLSNSPSWSPKIWIAQTPNSQIITTEETHVCPHETINGSYIKSWKANSQWWSPKTWCAQMQNPKWKWKWRGKWKWLQFLKKLRKDNGLLVSLEKKPRTVSSKHERFCSLEESPLHLRWSWTVPIPLETGSCRWPMGTASGGGTHPCPDWAPVRPPTLWTHILC